MLMTVIDRDRECSELSRIWGKGCELVSITDNAELHYGPCSSGSRWGAGDKQWPGSGTVPATCCQAAAPPRGHFLTCTHLAEGERAAFEVFPPRGASEEGQQEAEAAPRQGDTQTHAIPRKMEEMRAALEGLNQLGS